MDDDVDDLPSFRRASEIYYRTSDSKRGCTARTPRGYQEVYPIITMVRALMPRYLGLSRGVRAVTLGCGFGDVYGLMIIS